MWGRVDGCMTRVLSFSRIDGNGCLFGSIMVNSDQVNICHVKLHGCESEELF